MSTKTVKTIEAGYEPLPGYVLEETIGRGGFGEVWRCSAPGGMKKACKFVFGSHDQSRATRELRSLERIKGVRHPFLLTLERFEIVDQQLVIVTELADGSLEDVFKSYRDNGSCGIPRVTLLSHLQDAADALDYLHKSYQLQHLDVKPGNLLMIGGHVKVADFGLLKDLRDVDCSVVGGLTPIYAPPEVFDGKPSLHSDQYSLAVMYQELLTGTRPFSGRTIAQLATQHVHSAPNLEPLPPADRVVAARALEKDPSRRFASCREFVEALRDGWNVNRVSVGGQSSLENALEVAAQAPVDDLPQLGLHSGASSSHVTQNVLVVAIGGTGAECVRELRRRVSDLRAVSPIELHSALIDTDMATIHSMRLAEVSERVSKCNLIYTPLKSANEYRDSGTDRLKTISRRWIYNVPRSGSTEGMRPLGRLALVDHGPVVAEKLSKSVEQLVESSEGRMPLVYIVGSIAGGTASGMFIDVAHLLRHFLDQAGLADTKILSLLATAPLRVDPHHPIALHDTQAAIKEIGHFLQAGNGYPGDEGAGWPSVPAARTPLRNVYLIAGSQDSRYGVRPSDTIAEYLWANANGCGELLAEARKSSSEEKQEVHAAAFRSVGVIPLGDCHRLEEKLLGPALVRDLMISWLGNPAQASKSANESVHRLMRRIGLYSDSVKKQILDHFAEKQVRFSTYLAQVKGQYMHEHPGEDFPSDGKAIAWWLELSSHRGEMDWLCAGWINSLYREISVGLSNRRIDLATSIETMRLIREKLATLTDEVCLAFPQLDDHSVAIDEVGPQAVQQRFVDIASCIIAKEQLHHLDASIKHLEERLERFGAILAIAIMETKSEAPAQNPWEEMPDEMQEQHPAVLKKLHDTTVNNLLVRPLNDHAANVDARFLIDEITPAAIDLIIPLVRQHGEAHFIRADRTIGSSVSQPDLTHCVIQRNEPTGRSIEATQYLPDVGDRLADTPVSIEEAVELVRPGLLALGGKQRLILIVSNEVERGQLEPQLRSIYEGAVTVAVIPGSDAKLIHEAQGIELKSIIARLTVLGGGNEQVTERLASRSDVKW
ncbi:Tubulin-like protein [Rubripirellula amarantea]|uniref:Tubulin-like protein n=1 Tax=Rubripirellula amarantea TaxID=2527999 RepID=A0A5C5WEY9_9BACT|nr:tubulin-like doman-containing protein [Rubripirellula amarantea]TWT49348.1 Tubulin-like protein [Rubripirellula amarantea]